jgi:CRP/FNR family transcriptional regulator, anaerobic regulatory protein
VCVLPFDRVEKLAQREGAFQHQLYRLLSAAIVRERTSAMMLGTMRAEQRLAAFLLDLSNRYRARGYSSTEFVLRMTREEIGSQLGLKLETVSRLFSRFHEEGLIEVQGRVVKLVDRIGLQQLLAAS